MAWRNLGRVKGEQGAPGVGIPTGGLAGQVLKKRSANNYDVNWENESGGGGTIGSLNPNILTIWIGGLVTDFSQFAGSYEITEEGISMGLGNIQSFVLKVPEGNDVKFLTNVNIMLHDTSNSSLTFNSLTYPNYSTINNEYFYDLGIQLNSVYDTSFEKKGLITRSGCGIIMENGTAKFEFVGMEGVLL